jgi:hypothetical protein
VHPSFFCNFESKGNVRYRYCIRYAYGNPFVTSFMSYVY